MTSLLFMFLILNMLNADDTLYHYNPHTNKVNYRVNNALFYMARFDLQKSVVVKSIQIYLDGTGTGEVRLFGHEGGTAYAELEKDLIEPIGFTKNTTGRAYIDVSLPNAVALHNKQFFVVIDISGSNLFLVRDTEIQQAKCASTNGGNFFPTVLAVPGNHPFYDHLWQVSTTALW